jgi:acyl-CoA thioesterase FadM
LHQRAKNKRTDDVKCECETVMVVMDNDLQKSMDIPLEFRTAVAAFEENNIFEEK